MKKQRYILCASLFINLLFVVFVLRRLYFQYYYYPKCEAETHQQQEKFNKDPKNSLYFMNKDKLFKDLPNGTNEIIFVGDSHIQNFETSELLKIPNVINRGISGDITRGVYNRLNELTESKPKKIFIEIGVNDLLYNIPMETVMENYNKIIKKIKTDSPGTKIYVHSLLPTSVSSNNKNTSVLPDIILLNQKLFEMCKKEGIDYIDLFSIFDLNDGLNPEFDNGDGLHLNGKAYLCWSARLKKYLNE